MKPQKMVDHAHANKHYRELAWQVENERDIHDIAEEDLTREQVAEAFGDMSDEAFEAFKALVYCGGREGHMTDFVRNLVRWYVFDFAADKLKEQQQRDRAEFYAEEHPSLTDAERNGMRGPIDLKDL